MASELVSRIDALLDRLDRLLVHFERDAAEKAYAARRQSFRAELECDERFPGLLQRLDASGHLTITTAVADAILGSDDPAALLDYLLKKPPLLVKLSAFSPEALKTELASITRRLSLTTAGIGVVRFATPDSKDT